MPGRLPAKGGKCNFAFYIEGGDVFNVELKTNNKQ
jgi:hypothetical protein